MREPIDEPLPLWENRNMPKRTTKEEASLRYVGPAVDDGTMRVEDLGNALLGYAKMVRATVQEASPNAVIPDIRVIRTAQGSFDIILTIETLTSIWEAIRDWVTSSDGQAAETLLTLGGGIAGAVAATVAVGKKIRNRHITRREKHDDKTETVTLNDGEQLTAPTIIINTFINPSFRDGAQKIIEPTTSDGVDRVELSSATSHEQASEVLTREDFTSFRALPEDGEHATVEEAFLEVDRLAFDGGPWRFTRHFRTAEDRVPESFNATVADKTFLASVSQRGVGFRAGDCLRVRLEEVTPTHSRKHRRFTVLEVLEVQQAGTIDDVGDL